ncbi:FecR family protein [Sphingomonas quercus]|uniref:FecR domain-containing protein n=1 Tax=Sphingomonas quercus TaxID=2842451 RepID=A0ABS6BK19_9SPHN|nr:FecR domain-containing protein [Sphingomonas quercus]MBU3077604.1 FecR domain-containing protein [Sphingomonas quercus]
MSGEPSSRIDEDACGWVARMDRGLTSGEEAALATWLASDDRKRGALLRAQAAFRLLDRARALRVDAGEAEAGPVDEHPHSRRALLGLGGGMAALLALGAVWRVRPRGQHIATGVGEIRRLPLEDGSLAVVNSDSSVRVAFSAGGREVELVKGEAWFEVAHNKARPFTVAAGAARVRAVGTAFDVRRHRDRSEIVVTDGVVKIWSTRDAAAPTLVAAGHRAVLWHGVDGAARVAVRAVDPEQPLAWRDGQIILDDMTLAAAADEFNRYNKMTLVIDPAIGGRRMIGSFRTNDVDGFVEAAALLVGGRVARAGNIIRIVPAPPP